VIQLNNLINKVSLQSSNLLTSLMNKLSKQFFSINNSEDLIGI